MNNDKTPDSLLFPTVLFLLTIVTRIPFTSKLLYHMDSVQFALALERYDVTVHQPHPPGYFLYVMLGRLFNFFIGDANSVFVSISIIFSGLTVAILFYLGKEIFDKRTGVIAAILAITSPNLWFHGEVALSYIVEAFFSTTVAFFCWKVHKGEHGYIWLSVIILGIAGGIRQNTAVFLLPLLLFSVKEVPVRKVLLAVCLLGLVCLAWFVPMVWMTGGWNAYMNAFRELWMFNTGQVSVFEKGWGSFKIFSSAILSFSIYGAGAAVFALGLAAYSLIRRGMLRDTDISKASFFSLWIFPSVVFYLLIFIHPANPGYVLIYLPALLLLAAAAVDRIGAEIGEAFKRDKRGIAALILMIIAFTNASFFLFSKYPVSLREIRDHDKNLSLLIDGIKTHDPKKTAVFVRPFIFYGYRQIMYYLPDYRVYDVDLRVAPTGEVRKVFWGANRSTHLTINIDLPKEINSFVTPLDKREKSESLVTKGLIIKDLLPDILMVSGPLMLLDEVYPELKRVLR